MFVTSGVPVYEGQIVGESRREKDMNVNVTRAKKLTNIRAAGKDEAAVLTPPRRGPDRMGPRVDGGRRAPRGHAREPSEAPCEPAQAPVALWSSARKSPKAPLLPRPKA